MTQAGNRSTARLASMTLDLMHASPFVIGMRLSRMAAAGVNPGRRDRREFDRMVLEKGAAFAESWHAAMLHALQAQQRLMLSLLRTWWLPGGALSDPLGAMGLDHSLDACRKALAPYHRRAVSNARRLRR